MIPDLWYPVAISGDVTNKKPTPLRRLGGEYVAWRDIQGNVVIQDARCPHKGAHLGYGRMKGNSVECPYHGFLFNNEGACTLTPAMGAKARIPGSLKIKTYPVREKHGLIWMWWGDDRPESELPEIIAPSEIRDNEKLFHTISWNKPVHYTRYVESVLEFYHITYVHRDSIFNYLDFTFLYGTLKKLGMDGKDRFLEATMIHNHHVETDDDGMTFRYSFDHGSEADPSNTIHYVITFSFPCMVHVKTEAFETTSWFMPIDDETTEHIFRVYEFPQLKPYLKSEKLRRSLAWLQTYLEKFVQDPQDYAVMEHQQPRITGGGVNKFIPVDEMNAKYVKTRARLMREARERREGIVSAEVDDGMVGGMDMAGEESEDAAAAPAAKADGKRRSGARANGSANGHANGSNGNGHANGSANGSNGNGHANGSANGSNGNGKSRARAAVPMSKEVEDWSEENKPVRR